MPRRTLSDRLLSEVAALRRSLGLPYRYRHLRIRQVNAVKFQVLHENGSVMHEGTERGCRAYATRRYTALRRLSRLD